MICNDLSLTSILCSTIFQLLAASHFSSDRSQMALFPHNMRQIPRKMPQFSLTLREAKNYSVKMGKKRLKIKINEFRIEIKFGSVVEVYC